MCIANGKIALRFAYFDGWIGSRSICLALPLRLSLGPGRLCLYPAFLLPLGLEFRNSLGILHAFLDSFTRIARGRHYTVEFIA